MEKLCHRNSTERRCLKPLSMVDFILLIQGHSHPFNQLSYKNITQVIAVKLYDVS